MKKRSKAKAKASKRALERSKWRAAALKAWRTRRANSASRSSKNLTSAIDLEKNKDARLIVIRLLAYGIDPDLLAKVTGLKRRTIAAYRAHQTMGTYRLRGA